MFNVNFRCADKGKFAGQISVRRRGRFGRLLRDEQCAAQRPEESSGCETGPEVFNGPLAGAASWASWATNAERPSINKFAAGAWLNTE
jgi:hypothetical protein